MKSSKDRKGTALLEIINKLSMPDVFVVVVRTSELRSDKKYNRNGVPVSIIIISKLETGTTLISGYY